MEFTYDSTTAVNRGCQPRPGYEGSLIGVRNDSALLRAESGDPLFTAKGALFCGATDCALPDDAMPADQGVDGSSPEVRDSHMSCIV
jgi:hypothetical protein